MDLALKLQNEYKRYAVMGAVVHKLIHKRRDV